MLQYTEEHRVTGRNGTHVVSGTLRDPKTGAELKTKTTINKTDDAKQATITQYGHALNPLNDLNNTYLSDVVRTIRDHPFATLLGTTDYVRREHARSAQITTADICEIWDALEVKIGMGYSFSEFKAYLIDYPFVGVD